MSTGKWNRVVRLVCVLAVGVCSVCGGQVIYYVDDDAAGAHDGSSWQDAYNYLQDALAAAASAGRDGGRTARNPLAGRWVVLPEKRRKHLPGRLVLW